MAQCSKSSTRLKLRLVPVLFPLLSFILAPRWGGDVAAQLVDHDDYTDEEAEATVAELDESAVVVQLITATMAVDCPTMKRLLKRADDIGCEVQGTTERHAATVNAHHWALEKKKAAR